MKKHYLSLCVALATLLFSCSDNDANQDEYEAKFAVDFTLSEKTLSPLEKTESASCATMDLIAGQHYPAGEVVIEKDDSYLYITYVTDNNWVIDATHLFAGICEDIPQTKSGNPKVGVFDYATTHNDGVNFVQYAIELEFFEECFCVAAHAEVSLTDDAGNVIQAETAWGSGVEFDGNSWAMYKEFCQTGCESTDDGPGER